MKSPRQQKIQFDKKKKKRKLFWMLKSTIKAFIRIVSAIKVCFFFFFFDWLESLHILFGFLDSTTNPINQPEVYLFNRCIINGYIFIIEKFHPPKNKKKKKNIHIIPQHNHITPRTENCFKPICINMENNVLLDSIV